MRDDSPAEPGETRRVSQYRPPSYAMAPPSRPARWPWALAIVVLLAIGAIGALIITGGNLSSGNDGPQTVAGPNGEMIIVAPSGSGAASDPASAAAASPSSDASASASIDPAGAPASGPTETNDLPASAGPTVPPPTATPTGPTNAELAADWAAKWQAGDFQGMYALLSDAARKETTEDAFVKRYQAIYDRATITKVAVTMDSGGIAPEVAAIPFTVDFTSTQLGEFSQDNTLPLVQQNGVWTVAWTPSAILDGLADNGCVDVEDKPTERGMILDRNGEVLAKDEQLYIVGVQVGEIQDEASLNQRLAGLLGMTADEVAATYADADPSYFMPVRTLPEADTTPIANELGQIPGVRLRSTSGRLYPFGAVAAHITGYVTAVSEDDTAKDPTLVDGGMVGRTGLEAGANDTLGGKAGATLSVVDCDSRAVQSTIADVAPVPGQDLILTIDIKLQQAVDKVLSDVQGDDERGSAVLLDPRNGAVLAMVSHPNYDPNDFTLGFSSDAQKRFNDATLIPWLDRASEGQYPVGSIFKVITMAGGMAHLGYDENTVLDCPSSYELNGNIYNDWVIEWGEQPQGQLTLHDALVQSCNTVFYDIGAKLDQKDDMFLPDMARAFGLGAPTNIPYLPESGGVIPDPAWKQENYNDGWSTGDAINMAIGQGFVLATPLQMANVYATVANGGTLLQPFIVEYTQVPGGPATRVGKRTEMGKVPLQPGQMTQIQQALRDQTSNAQERGSARVFGAGYPFAIAGKTGTSENPTDRGSKPHSWFAAFGPWEDSSSVPTIASVVMIENIGEGGKFAAPATKAIYDYYMKTDLADHTDADEPPPQAVQPTGPGPSPASLPSSSAPPSTSGRRGRRSTRLRSGRTTRPMR
jgi:penicillin-binding protein 2